MKLYYSPGACSIGVHYLLERMKRRHDTRKVDIKAGDHLSEWYGTLNPKRKVPTLVLDNGAVLTEFPVISRYLAEESFTFGYLPAEPVVLLRASELTNYLVSTVHMQGFSRVFRPAKFSDDPASHDLVKAQGLRIVKDGLAIVDRQIDPGSALAGRVTFADAALFYILFWAAERLRLELPEACASKWSEFKSDPATARVFESEGIGI